MVAFCTSLLQAFAFIEQNSGAANLTGRAIGAMTTACLFAVSVAYSRLFLGVHSLDQVLFGGLIGIWLAVSIHY